MTDTKMYKKGDSVTTKNFGAGTIVSVDKVELPSDNDPLMLTVKCADGKERHLKAADLK